MNVPETQSTAPSVNAPPLIEAEGLGRRFGSVWAVRELRFTLRRGEILGFLGPNGAGKSTTMQMLTGNLAPSAGRVRIAGVDLKTAPRAAKRHLGYLPEIPPLYRDARVDEYLRFCAGLHGVSRARIAAAVARVTERCGLGDVRKRLIGPLSKGYQQRVGIAQAIVHEPDVVILDEPTVGLDPIQIIEIRALIAELGRDHGVVVSTHILSEVQAICNRVQIIRRGELVFRARMDELDGSQARLRVRFARSLEAPVLRDLLAGIAGVRGVEARDAAWLLNLAPDADADRVADAVVALAAEQDLGLRELAPEKASLEPLFVDLTVHERPAS